MPVIGLDLYVYALIEQFLKQNWVLKYTFEKSFRSAMAMFDSLPFEALLVDASGTVAFSNELFLDMSGNIESKSLHRLKEFIHEDDVKKLSLTIYKAIEEQKVQKLAVKVRSQGSSDEYIR